MKNHYVPQWYQKGFLSEAGADNKFHYLNLKPDSINVPSGHRRVHNALHRYGPRSCFYEEDLYTTRFGQFQSNEIEEKFFGAIDDKGKDAVAYFRDFEHPSVNYDAFRNMILYLSVQKLRTPKGLEYLGRSLRVKDKNRVLLEMQKLQRLYCAIWSESVWVIADASQSDTKFILSDHPITVYNMASRFPETQWSREKNDPEIWESGTHTLFPLNQDKILILTNQSWVRNPYGNPTEPRPNPKPFRDAMFAFMEIQTGRMLSESDVLHINYIIKKRAYRYIASIDKEWLYPERYVATQNWRQLSKNYLLMPDPRLVKFTTEIAISYSDNVTHSFDAYGRRPSDPDYQNPRHEDKERKTFVTFQKQYAKRFGPKRRGITYDSGTEDAPAVPSPL